jgi:DNA-binding LacI/PurR family transcriptional regulator
VAQIADQLRAEIRTGKLRPNDKLLSIQQMSRMGGVSEGIIRQALELLATEGYVRKRQGSGTFVNDVRPHQKHLAVVVPSLELEHVLRLLNGIKQALSSTNKDLVVHSAESDFEREEDLIRKLDVTSMGGAIIYPPMLNRYADSLRTLQRKKFPFVLVDTLPEGIEADFVVADTKAMGHLAATQLFEAGHRRIGYISTSSNSVTAAGVWEGILDAARTFNVPPPYLARVSETEVVLDERHPWAKGEFLTERLLAEHTDITGLIGANSNITQGILRAAKRLCVRVPETLSIIGIEGAAAFALTEPPLTVVDAPYEDLGRRAVQRLQERIEAPGTDVEGVRLAPKLVRRDSVRDRRA